MKQFFTVIQGLVFIIFSFAKMSHAQEIQVQIDQEGKLEYIDEELEQKLGLFNDYNNFREARLFQVSDTTFVLEIFYQQGEKLLKTRTPFSLQETQDFRRKVTEQIKKQSLQVYLNQEGRWPLVFQNMSYGIGLYGWILPHALDAEDPRWYIGAEMLSLGTSFYLTYQLTKNMEITHARSQMMRYGSIVGLRYGFGINRLFNLEFDESKLYDWILMASVPAGIYAGDKLFKRWKPSHGQAWSLSLWGDIGSYSMVQLHHIIETEPEDPDDYFHGVGEGEETEEYRRREKEHKRWEKNQVIYEMVGYPLGTYFARYFFGRQSYTFGDALMLAQGRGIGWMYGAMLGDITGADFYKADGRLWQTGGTILGPLLMNKFIKGYDYTFGQSILSILGTTSGMAFGTGIGVILLYEENDAEKIIEIMAMGGGLAGLYLSNSILNLKREKKQDVSESELSLHIFPMFRINKNSQTSKRSILPAITMVAQF